MLSQDYKRGLFNRIYIVYLARKIMCTRGLSIGWLVLSSVGLLWFVSILNVARNFWVSANDFGSAYGFVTHTVTHTSLVVQAILIGIVAALAFFAVDFYRSYLYTR